jgi:HK97 gp10 family phage protein
MAGPIRIETKITGSEEVQKRFASASDTLRKYVRDVLKRIGEDITGRAKSAAPVRRGRLQRSIRSRLLSEPGKMTVRVGPRSFIGRFLEGGIPAQTVQVKGYIRHNKAADVRGTVTTKTGKERKGVIAKGVSFVKAYTRPFHVDARPFMKPAYGGREETYRAQIRDVVMRAVREG